MTDRNNKKNIVETKNTKIKKHESDLRIYHGTNKFSSSMVTRETDHKFGSRLVLQPKIFATDDDITLVEAGTTDGEEQTELYKKT